MIGIVNYGLGNIQAFVNIYRNLNIGVKVLEERTQIDENITKLILPGVGSFDWAMRLLDDSGLREKLEEKVLGEKCPILGVCVGMQILCGESEEGRRHGLGWIDAEVKRIHAKPKAEDIQLPHMGWNNVRAVQDDGLFLNLENDPSFYFLHSFYVQLNDQQLSLANVNYGLEFTAALQSGCVFGTQFHPEKSHGNGIRILKNFAEMQHASP